MSTEDQKCVAAILPLVERAERLLATSVASPRTPTSFAGAQRALQNAVTSKEATRWLSVLGGRALAAALDTHLAERSRHVEPQRDADVRAVLSALLEVAIAAVEAEEQIEKSGAEAYPLARCAAIAASIARRKAGRSAILERIGLDSDAWTALERYWAEVIKIEIKRGKTELLSAYDEAYVAQLEAERGPVEVEDYARLVVSAERGTQQQVLAELDLPGGAVPRLQRVWLRRTAQDKALARRLRAALGACD